MTRVILDCAGQARRTFTASRLQPGFRCGPLQPASTARQAMQPGTTFDDDLVAQLPVLRRYAQKLTRDREEEAMDLVQDTCERALRFRHLFREGTNLRAWVLTIMRHHFLDAIERRDAIVSGHRVPLEGLSEWAQSDARAEDIRYVKEVLELAGEGLSHGQASVFWPMLAGASREECAALGGVSNQTVANRLHRARSFMRRACAA